MSLSFRRGVIAACLLVGAFPISAEVDRWWPQWRGPQSTGVAAHGDPPIEWSDRHNVRWKTALPGVGHSTPIVWDDRVFVTTAIPVGQSLQVSTEHHDHGAHDNMPPSHSQRFVVLALERESGEVVWQKDVHKQQPHESAHITASWASPSPVTDGKLVIASFGSRGLFALDFAGNLVWQRDLVDMKIRHAHGEGSSPALAADLVVTNWDHQGASFVTALEVETGEPRWRVERDEITSWSTPLIVEHGDGHQVIVSATERVRSYDLETGKEIWNCPGLSRNVVASPVAANGLVYVANSYDWQAMLAIRLAGARGDLSASESIVWRTDRLTPYVPSPVVDRGVIFFMAHNQGIVTGLDAETGSMRYQSQRVSGVRNVFASPVAAAGRLYVTSREGTTAVYRIGTDLELLAVNQLEDSFSASPAIVGRELFLRGEESLFCLAEESKTPVVEEPLESPDASNLGDRLPVSSVQR